MVSVRRRSTVTVILVVAVLIAAAGPSLASATTLGPQNVDDRFSQRDGSSPTNNTTVPHENPASVGGDGNVSELQNWLSGRLSQTLIDCSEGLQVGRYDACNRSESNYPDWLDKYVNVTRDTDSETNKTTAFERTAENQSEYASDVRRFRTTVAAYRDARENGSTQRARRLARQAQRIASRVNETGGRLTRGYRTIDNGTSQDLSSAVDTTRTITRNVTATADAVSVEQFRNTTITATADARRISFREPLSVTGRLVAANGTPLSNHTVELRAGNRTRRTTTNASGAYAITYRPTLLSLDTQQVTLRYRPTNLSVYRSNRTAVPVTVRQVQPTLRATGGPQNVSVGEVFTVNGSVAVDDTGVRSVPVAVAIDGRELTFAGGERAWTSSNGLFRVPTRLPKGVSAGQQTARVSLPFENRALGRANESIPVTVASTPTALSIDGSQRSVNGSAVGGPIVRVAGRLTTNDGMPVRNQSVSIEVNGTAETAARTDENGRYTANVTVPEDVFADQTGSLPIGIVAAYDGTGTNLESSQARTTVQLALPTQPEGGLLERLASAFGDVPWPYWLVVGLALVLVVGYGASRYRERTDRDRPAAPATEQGGGDDRDRTGPEGGPASLLGTARERLSAGDAAGAVGVAYTAVRRTLGRDLGLSATYTHWEFLDACLDRDVDDRRCDALRRLTERYERATFSQRSLSTETATAALEDAQSITDADERSESAASESTTDADS